MANKKRVTISVTFDMDNTEESIKNFEKMKHDVDSGILNEELSEDGWFNVKTELKEEDIN